MGYDARARPHSPLSPVLAAPRLILESLTEDAPTEESKANTGTAPKTFVRSVGLAPVKLAPKSSAGMTCFTAVSVRL